MTALTTSVTSLPRRQVQIAGGVAAAAVVVAAAVAALILRPAPVVVTGTLVIDAVPWATVTAIDAQDGTSQALPALASTPLSLSLPVGTYTVRLAGPPPASEPRQITVQVQEGILAVPQVERFQSLTPEEYFEPYLAAPAPVSEPPATEEGTAATPADPAADPQAAPARPPGALP